MILYKVKTEDMPHGWISIKIGKILEFNYGKGLTKSKRDPSGKIPVYGSNGIVGYHNQALIENSAIIVGRKGAVGKVHLSEGPFWPIDTTYYVIPPTGLDIKFVNYILNSLNLSSLDKSTAIPGLNRDDAYNVDIYIPPSSEQHRIVFKIEELFTKLDAGVEGLKKVKVQLNRYRQAVLKSAFEGKLTKEWREKNPYTKEYKQNILRDIEEFNNKKKDKDLPRRLPPMSLSDLPSLPLGWFWIEAHKICQSVRDGTHDTPKYVEHGIPLVTSKNLKNGKIDFSSISLISEEDHQLIKQRSGVERNDILYAMIGTIGNPVIVGEDNMFSIKNIGLFKNDTEFILPKYLKYWLGSWIHVKILEEKDLIRGTTQKFISLGGLRVLPIPMCSVEEQDMIIKEIELQLSLCDSIQKDIELNFLRIKKLHQGILSKAFQGKLVPQDSTDEPAYKLLERIKSEKEQAQQDQKRSSKNRKRKRK